MRIFGNRGLSPTVAFQGTESSAMSKKRSWFALAIIVFTLSLIGTGLSGCRGPWVDAKVFVDNSGDLYIDIPEAQKYKHAVLYDLGVYKSGSQDASGIYWSIIKSGYSSNADVTALPLRYGANVIGLIAEFPAKKLESGTYYIRGFIKFFDSDELEKVGASFVAANIVGRFAYEDGVARNLTYQQ